MILRVFRFRRGGHAPHPSQFPVVSRELLNGAIEDEALRSAVDLARAEVRLRDQEERIRTIELERRVLGRDYRS